ncbi:MAG: 1,4-dihydroxy-6-naphthoate synthase [Planctomycetota bacterium]|nr:1,4-dihydroxy-6-naphthoate synthase [Planctomycetota bacterium]
MTQRIRLGISTCPNDTFAFHALMQRKVDWRGLEFQIELLDIQQLNSRAFQGELDIAKVSFHAALFLADEMVVLPSGSALGFGVGPLLLAAKEGNRPTNSSQIALCPGEHTTATLLFQLFYPNTAGIEQVVFSEIMPRLKSKTSDFGVCIHEGRFTWQSEGLFLVEDLGTRWEAETKCPLPLGGIVGKRSLGLVALQTVQSVICDSLNYGLAHREETFPTMRYYAQEFNDEVLMQHVDLYVNAWTVQLGTVGQTALMELSERAQKIGLVSSGQGKLKLLDEHQ